MPASVRLPNSFSPNARRLIASYSAMGFTGRVSSKGHWIGHGPDGRTTVSVAPKLRGRGRTVPNQVAELVRLERRIFTVDGLGVANHVFDRVGGARVPSWS